jgi:hypothetical protein
VSLSGKQWIVCLLVALSVVVVSEIQKVVRRRRAGQAAAETEEAPESVAVATTP